MSNPFDLLPLDVLGIITMLLDFETIHSLIQTLFNNRKKVFLIKDLGKRLKTQIDNIKNNTEHAKTVFEIRHILTSIRHANKCSLLLKSVLNEYQKINSQ